MQVPLIPSTVLAEAAKQLPKPPTLTTACSISTAMPAETFFSLLKSRNVTALADIRCTRFYQGAFWSSSRDIEYLCRIHSVSYIVLEDLAPDVDLRKEFHSAFDPAFDRRDYVKCEELWTAYLQDVAKLFSNRKVLSQEGPVRNLLYGSHSAIAFTCNCKHHSDCHRSVALGIIARYIEGVTVAQLYENGKPPPRVRGKTLLFPIENAGLVAEKVRS